MNAKRLLVIGLAVPVACAELFGQASFRCANYESGGRVNAPVYDWTGNLLSGPSWRAELYGGANADSLSPAVDFDWGMRVPSVFTVPGYFSRTTFTGGDLVVPDVPWYGWAWLQVRVWDTGLGATYEEALARGVGGYGASALFYAQGSYPGPLDPSPPAPLIGLQSFSVSRIVPEPSAWLLLALGAGGLAWRLRRRREASFRQEQGG